MKLPNREIGYQNKIRDVDATGFKKSSHINFVARNNDILDDNRDYHSGQLDDILFLYDKQRNDDAALCGEVFLID